MKLGSQGDVPSQKQQGFVDGWVDWFKALTQIQHPREKELLSLSDKGAVFAAAAAV